MKKLTFDYVKSYFTLNKCELLESTYINAKTLMKYKCVCDGISLINFDNFRIGKRCRKCGIKTTISKTKYSYEYVCKFFDDNCCTLLENNYENCFKKMSYICKCGRISQINFHNFLNGRRCKKCGQERITGSNNYNWNPNRDLIANNLNFRKRCYNVLYSALNILKLKKTDKYKLTVGYTSRELKNHLINHANWNIVKNGLWEVDHIYPIKAFLDFGIKDIKIVNALSNLQPISRHKNRVKSDNYDKKEFVEWLIENNIDYTDSEE